MKQPSFYAEVPYQQLVTDNSNQKMSKPNKTSEELKSDRLKSAKQKILKS